MDRFIPDWLAWLIVRWQHRQYEHVKVTGPMARFLGARLQFQHPQTKVSYRAHFVRRLNDATALVLAERLSDARP